MSSRGDDKLIGTVLDGRYRVLGVLASGGMGAIYEGEQLAVQRRVAIKMLHAHLARDEEIVTRFRREALATTKIGHPHIVDVIDLGELADGTLFMVLELLQGRDLARVLRDDGPLPVARAAKIVMQVCEGVGAAHAKGIVHRDLKPENVFLIEQKGDRDFVKVLDFGVSKIREGEGVDAKTRTGTALGTPYYMAPEQAQGKKSVDARADVYSLGVILFRVLSGHHPFDDDSYPALIVKICTEPHPPITQWRSDLPRELVQLIDRMLAKDPIERPQTMEVVCEELRSFAGVDVAPALTGAPAPEKSTPALFERTRDHSKGALARTQHRNEDEDAVNEEVEKALPAPKRGGLLAMFALVAAATIAIVAYATVGPGADDPPPEPPEVALPTPREPLVRALAPRGGESTDWTWINPRPRAMPTWYAVQVGGAGLVAMVGQDGAAARFFGGSTLVTWRSGTRSTLRAVAWTSTEDALAVGEGGTIVRLTPHGPRAIASGTEADLRAIAILSGTEALVAGDEGTLLRLRGDRVGAIETGIDLALLALHDRGGIVWIAGERGTIAQLEGDRVRTEGSGTGVTLRAIGGCERGDLYAAGDQGTLLRRRSDGTWQNVRSDAGTGTTFTSITCDRNHAAIVGSEGTVILASRTTTVRMASGTDATWHGVSGAADETTWLAGAGGRIATIEEDHVQTRTDGPTVPLRDVSAIGGALVAVGEWGRIVREREHGFEQAESPTDAALAALAPIDEGRLLAVGDSGAIAEVSWDAARMLSSPTDASLRSVLVSNGHVLAVGTGGALLRGAPDALSASRVPDVGDLWGIAGAADDAIAVGASSDGTRAAVVHVSAGAVSSIPCDAPPLRAVMRRAGGDLAVGEEGAIVRIADGGCVREHSGGPTLAAIALGPDGSPMAVGDDGAALVRADDGTWTELDLELGGNHARAIRRIGRHVYVVGTGGVIIRHVVTDGS